MAVKVLRLGHRSFRDQRVSTHCGLVARAFGAQGMYYTGQKDSGLESSIEKVAVKWGGKFRVSHKKTFKDTVKGFNGKIVHLTVYGIPIEKRIREIRKSKSLLVVVGGEKVPPEVYQKADFNISVTGQPHSEIASLAVFLHEYFKGKELGKSFPGATLKVIPQDKGKLVKKA